MASEWTRERQSFSCTDDIWDAAKQAWSDQIDKHPAWTDWLESALAEGAARTKQSLHELKPAPARIPPGRRQHDGTRTHRRRRSFTCQPEIWQMVRDAWWTESGGRSQLSDWIEAAIAAKAQHSLTEREGRP